MTEIQQKIVTRFAPSPTGFLHIGGARTALFNWAFARHHGGKFLLRIEDTDRKRSNDKAISAILDTMNWLNIHPDATPVYQHKNASRHIEVAYQLLEQEKAYLCNCSVEDLDKMRKKAKDEGKPWHYDRTCRHKNLTPDTTPFVIRFKSSQSGTTLIEDKIQGNVTIENHQCDDLILLRSDGTPTYMLSVVVDDHDMGVTHIIRGDDHLTNTARQKMIYEALSWPIPTYAHLPLIHGADGAKLSKRHAALGVDAYRDMGYLPEALCNYLARLGWSHGDKELFTNEELISWFDLNAIGKAPSRFDLDKLDHVNAHHLRQMSVSELSTLIIAQEPRASHFPDLLSNSLPIIKKRCKRLTEIEKVIGFLFKEEPIKIDSTVQKHLTNEVKLLLSDLLELFKKELNWTNTETITRNFIKQQNIKFKDIGPALRTVLTGEDNAIGIFDLLTMLGKEKTCQRIADQLIKKNI